MNIYVASSWRNKYQPGVVNILRGMGHDVYDFRNPAPGNTGFSWAEIDPDWQKWTPEQFFVALGHPVAVSGFNNDFKAMRRADCCLLVLPCGRSAHAEAGYFAGSGKPVYVFQPEPCEPELTYKLFTLLFTDPEHLARFFYSKLDKTPRLL